MLRRIVASFICLLLASVSSAQKGCTDPQATNYMPSATVNDGSCIYPNTFISPSVLIGKLSDTLNETSGLAQHNGSWYSQNDGGNPPLIYRINTAGKIQQSIAIRNQTNTDWEELTFSDSFGFLGDFGNNAGNRKDLKILKFPIQNWPTNGQSDTVSADVIAFSYADQTQFNASSNATAFDAEAMIFWNDSLHIFSKNWKTGFTKRYVLPAIPGTYSVWPRDSLQLDFLVTGAAVHQNKIALVGYNTSGNGFLELLWDFRAGQPFTGNKRKISLGSFIAVGQIESIAFKDSLTFWATNEKYIIANRLMEIPVKSIWGAVAGTTAMKDVASFSVWPNPTKGSIHVQWKQRKSEAVSIRIYDSGQLGRSVFEKTMDVSKGLNTTKIQLPQNTAAGVYLVEVRSLSKGTVYSKTIIYQP